MANMHYCRFQNTLIDLRQCEEGWDDLDDDSIDEIKARYKILKLCITIVESFELEEFRPDETKENK